MFKKITLEKYPFLIAAKPWHRYGATALFIALLIATWFFLLYEPLLRKHQELAAQLYAYQKDISLYAQEQEKQKYTTREVAHLKASCDAYMLTHNDAPKKAVALMTKYAHTYNLRLLAMRQKTACDKKLHATAVMDIQMEGSLQDIYLLLHKLEKDRAARCAQLHITYQRPETYMLSMTCKIIMLTKKSPSTLEKS